MNSINLIPIGHVDKDVLNHLEDRLKAVFSSPCSVGEGVDLPPAAFNVERSQFLAPLILEEIRPRAPQDGEMVLGITDVDLYVPETNFIFGLADLGGPSAVISICRLREEFYGLKCDTDLFISRMVKEALHELGHSFGLAHCQNSECIMFFANSLIDTDKKEEQLCPTCQESLHQSQ